MCSSTTKPQNLISFQASIAPFGISILIFCTNNKTSQATKCIETWTYTTTPGPDTAIFLKGMLPTNSVVWTNFWQNFFVAYILLYPMYKLFLKFEIICMLHCHVMEELSHSCNTGQVIANPTRINFNSGFLSLVDFWSWKACISVKILGILLYNIPI